MRKNLSILLLFFSTAAVAEQLLDSEFLLMHEKIPETITEPPIDALLGWDIDEDGVRDDVQRNIILKYYKVEHKILRDALLQLARDLQLGIYDLGRKDNNGISQDLIRILEDEKCINDVVEYIKLKQPQDIKAFYEINTLKSYVFNISARSHLYSDLLAYMPVDLPEKIELQNANFWEFPIGDIPSQRKSQDYRIAPAIGNETLKKRNQNEKK